MAKFARCESCGTEAPLSTSMGLNPDGWVSASERTPGTYVRDFLACSPECMGLLMIERAKEILHAAAQQRHDDAEAARVD